MLNVGIQASDKTTLSSGKATIEVTRLGDSDQVLSTTLFNSAEDNSTGTPRLKFNSDVAVDGAKALLINITYPGFASYARRIEVQPLIFVDALLSKAPQSANPLKTGTFVMRSGEPVEGVQLDLTDSLTITIPNSLLPAQVLAAKAASYDPNSAAHAIYFPGQFSDLNGEPLIATAFDFIQLTNASGAAQDLIAGDKLVWIGRVLPESSCTTLNNLGDSDSQQAGWQVPLYGFNSAKGLWELAGAGTLYNADGSLLSTLNCPAKVWVEGQVAGAVINKQWLSFSFVQNPVAPVAYCASVQINNAQGEKLAGIYGLISAQNAGQFTPAYFTTGADGKARIEIAATGTTESIPAKLSLVNDGVVNADVVLTPNCSNPEPQTVILNRPRLCQIQGQVTDETGAPLINYPVVAQAASGAATSGLFDFAITDNQGIYWLNVACKQEFALKFTRFFNAELEVRGVAVDSTVSATEIKDDGQTARVSSNKVTTVATAISAAVYTLSSGDLTVSLFSTHANFPFAADLKIVNAKNEVVATVLGSLSDSANLGESSPNWIYGSGQLVQKVNLGDGKGLKILGSITDAKGKKTQVGVDPALPITVK